MKRLLLPLVVLVLVAWRPVPQTPTPPARLTLPQPWEGFGMYAEAVSDGRGFFVVSNGYGIALDGNGDRLAEESMQTGGANAIASNGREYLVVWFAPPEDPRTNTPYRILARRVAFDGRPIDREPILVGEAGEAASLSAAWNGSRYVIVFYKSFNTYVSKLVSENGDVESRELWVPGWNLAANTKGAVLYSKDRLLAAGGNGEFLSAYLDGNDLWVQRLDANGLPRAAAVQLSIRASDPAITWVNDRWLVAWTRARGNTTNIEAVRLGLDAEPFTIAENASLPVLASNGARALVSWALAGSGTRVTAMLDDTTVSNVRLLNRILGTFPSDTWMGTIGDTTLIAVRWGDNTDVWAARGGSVRYLRRVPGWPRTFATNGTHAFLATLTRWYVLDVNGNVLADIPTKVAYPWAEVVAEKSETGFLISWPVQWLDWNVYTINLQPDGTTSNQRLVTSIKGQFHVAMARSSTQTLMLWAERCAGCFKGELLGPGTHAIELTQGGTGSESYTPYARFHAASDGKDFLVVMTESDNLHIKRIGADGTIGRAITLHIDRPYESMWVGWTGEYYLILGRNLRDDHVWNQLYALRVDRDGKPIDFDFERVTASTHPHVYDVLIRDSGEIELVTAGDDPFGTATVNWRRLANTRRRAVR